MLSNITLSHMPSVHGTSRQVFQLLQRQESACRGVTHILFLGEQVCNRGFLALMGVGKQRFAKMHKAVATGSEQCPFDLRCVPRARGPASDKRQKVHDFLMFLYETAAESLPDNMNSNRRPRQASRKIDPVNLDRSKVRHLPPGTYHDYLRLLRAQNPTEKFSYKLFADVPRLVFGNEFVLDCFDF